MLFREYRLDFPGVQWLRIRLSMQGTWVQSLVWENPTRYGATKSMHHNNWSQCALEPVVCNKKSHHNEKARTPQWRQASLTAQKAASSHLCSPTRESPCAAPKNQRSQKKKRIETGTIGIENKLWHIVVLFLLLMQALIEV